LLILGFATYFLACRVVARVIAQKLIEMHRFNPQAVGGGQVSLGQCEALPKRDTGPDASE
jgi:hypothetical protein